MAESKFKQLQEDVCYKEPEEIPEPDKICPTCIPDPNYTPPNWRITRAPYLDKSKCLYMIKVDINIDGNVYYAANDIPGVDPKLGLGLVPISNSPYNQNTLLKSYIRPAVRKILRYYGKLETDEIVCAIPPQNPGEVCRGVHGVKYESYVTVTTQQTDEPTPSVFELVGIDKLSVIRDTEIDNPDALELFARVEDYDYLTNVKILSVLVGIPAFKFDSIPNAPDLGSVNTSIDKIVIKPTEFMIDMTKFKSAMSTFATYQAFFKQQENGSVYFEETSDAYYIRFFSDKDGRIDKFLERFERLLNNNDFSVRGLLDSGADVQNIAQEIEVSFDKSSEIRPFAIKNVRARKKNCPYVECKVGLQDFIDYSKKDQTMFGYFANIKNIGRDLSSNKTPPWIDFTVKNTYPQLAVNYGSAGNFEDTCVNNDLQDLQDFILKETVDAFKAIEYRYNQNRCKKPEDIKNFNKTLTEFLIEDGSEKAFNDFADAFAERARQLDALPKQILNIPKNIGETFSDVGSAIGDFISNLSPCGIKASMAASMKCIMAGLSAEEAYRAIIKQVISSAGEEALETILQSLPANQQEKIRKEVEKQFGDMPFPWEPGWQTGDLGGAVDRQARQNIETKEEKAKTAEENSASIEKQIVIIEEKIATARSRYFEQLTSDRESLIQEFANLQILPERIQIIKVIIDNIKINLEQARSVLPETSNRVVELKRELEEQQEELQSLESDYATFPEVERELNRLIEALSKQDDVFADTEANRAIASEQAKLEKDLEILKKKAAKEDKTVEDLTEYQDFSNLSEEEQAEIIEKQKEKTFLVKITPEDQIKQGTLGRALGNVQKALTQAYIDEIMKTASIGSLQRAFENIPGSDLLGSIIGQFKCPSGATIYPPIDSFLSTLTLDPCKGTMPKLALPAIPEITISWNWLEVLGEAFMFGMKQILSAVLVALMRKVAELLKTDLCKLTGNLLRGAADGGLEGVISELICNDPRPGDTQQRINQKVLEAGGARKRNPDDYKAVASVLSVSATQREIKAAMVGRADEDFLNNMSSIVSAVAPNFDDLFGDPSSVANYFQQMGNLLTQEQRNVINDQLNNPFDDDYPVETSICLTKEEKDQWDAERIAAFQDPDLGREFVNKQNDKALNDLSDAADLLLNGPDEALEDAIGKALNPKDPDCKTNSGVIPGFQDIPQDKRKTVLTATEGLFKRLEKAFLDDTVEGNFFEFTDPPGILLSILADRANRNIDLHIAIKNNPLLGAIFFLLGGSAELPETVGIRLKNQIDEISGEYSINPAVSEPAFVFYFNNGKEGNKAFSDVVTVEDNTTDDSIRIKDQFLETSVSYNLEVPEEFIVTNEEVREVDSSRAAMFKKLLEQNWLLFEDASISGDDAVAIYENINNSLYNDFAKKLIYRRENEMSEGFRYGKEGTQIVEDQDLVYVDPEPGATEYTYEEEDKVLGRSLTNNPRVHFLDPAKYGGTYMKPQIYIEEADHKGWLNFSKIIVPDPTGCDPKNSNFLMLDSIMKDIEKNKSKIKNHELLQYAPECTVELPFDKIANSDTLASLEGIIKATIRVYLTEFMIQSYSIFSNVDLTDRNFDNTLTEYISEFMLKGIKNQKSIFASTYEGYTYSLLFLEQVVQVVHRKVRDNQMESNEEIEEILNICNTAQENYQEIMPRDMAYITADDEAKAVFRGNYPELVDQLDSKLEAIKSGTAIIGSGGVDILASLQSLLFGLIGLGLDTARFANKINAIYQVETDIKKLLKYLVAEELQVYKDKLRDELSPRPHIYDISKFLIGGSNMLFGKNIDAGTFDTELPIGGGVGNFPYGDILECADKQMNHPLDGATLTPEEVTKLSEEGGFFLEKYLVVTPKENLRPAIVVPDHISGVTSLSEFKSYLNNYSSQFVLEKNISDYFGDATLNESETEYEGTIGIKYGVRLCYVPKLGFQPISNSQENRSIAKSRRNYIYNLFNLNGKISKYSFPITSYEQDITDVSIKDLLDSDSNFNQDLKCYIDKLCKTKEYRHLMNNVLAVTKIPSIMMIYAFNFFLPSLGDPSERDSSDEQEVVSPDNIGKIMNDSKSEARKLFVSFYKNNDRDPPNEEEDVDYLSQIQRQIVSKLSFIEFDTSLSFDIRRRLRTDNPHDKNGEECKNNFGKLFRVGGTS